MKKIILFGGGSFSKVLINEIKKQKNCKFEGIFDNKEKKKTTLEMTNSSSKIKNFMQCTGLLLWQIPKSKKKLLIEYQRK